MEMEHRISSSFGIIHVWIYADSTYSHERSVTLAQAFDISAPYRICHCVHSDKTHSKQ